MNPKLKWLIAIQLLLIDCTRCWANVPSDLGVPQSRNTTPMGQQKRERALGSSKPSQEPDFIGGSRTGSAGPRGKSAAEEALAESARRLVTSITAIIQARISPVAMKINTSCEELLASATRQDPSSALFPHEVLGLSLVPVLGAASCPQEAQALVVHLFDLLGQKDTEELLQDLQDLMERSGQLTPSAALGRDQAERHLQAVMFNIQQLARTEKEGEWGQNLAEKESEGAARCEGWTWVNETSLLGQGVEETDEAAAVHRCQSLGPLCAGVSHNHGSGLYNVVLRRHSHVLPSDRSECWIRECGPCPAKRSPRSTPQHCVDKREQRVYNVVEWIPAISTLYNLGTAVYYASINCTMTAKERAILSAVDLGTDALMAVTGGTVGVAGYALGAGVKTGVKAGVKYLLNNMKQEEDLIVNQDIWSMSMTID